ncbi:autotransporter outer membrane beta-barrel domain-containing protein [Pseudoxanthomonas sp.]|uniref:autotransporter outer membrane beta-barrel domain-containing protein n=1 Tax=Pseudoxanthomonas sp. TaxID=1871049 RepID=UPI00261E7B48|nr:autotransporter outer membrane beta-barrel domain-containing protein [Pseudoxanthomonas sp.]WDS35269.1 MAG: autotransporter outer membrane beta-barrel domain-containing protein [Pseudoxanthomonas sp.]
MWSAGTIRSGGTQGSGQRTNVDFQTDGVSVGADYRVNGRFAWGGGFGWARDDSDVGQHDSRSDATAQTIALYASYHPGQRWFVDGLIGYQNLSFDLARYLTANGGRVDANRDGRQWLASLSVGADLAFGQGLTLTPYGRVDVAHGTLDGYVEQGDAFYALRYASMDVATTTGNAGMKLDFRRRIGWGWFAPLLRMEYQHDFQGRSTARFGYADVLGAMPYSSTAADQDRNRFNVSAGAQLQTEGGFSTRLEVQSTLGNGSDSDHGVMLNIEKRY